MPVPAPVITFAAQAQGGMRSFAPSRASSPSPASSFSAPDDARQELKRLIIALEGDGTFKILPPLAYRRDPRRAELEWAFERTLGRIDEQRRRELGASLEAAACGMERLPERYEYALDVLKQYNCETFSRVMPVHPVSRMVHGLDRRGVAMDDDHAVYKHELHGWEDLHLNGRRIALVAGHERRELDNDEFGGNYRRPLPVPPRFDHRDTEMWYPFLAVQDAPHPDTVMTRSGSLTAKLDLFVAMRLALKQMTALHALAAEAAHRLGKAGEEHSEHTRQVFGILTYGKCWELHAMRICDDDEVVEVRVWEGALDRAACVVEFQSLLGHILSGAGERVRTIRTWLDILAEERRRGSEPRQNGRASRPQSRAAKAEPMDVESPLSLSSAPGSARHSAPGSARLSSDS